MKSEIAESQKEEEIDIATPSGSDEINGNKPIIKDNSENINTLNLN